MRRLILAAAIIAALNPGTNTWVEDNWIYMEKDGVVKIYKHEVIGEAWSHTLTDEEIAEQLEQEEQSANLEAHKAALESQLTE